MAAINTESVAYDSEIARAIAQEMELFHLAKTKTLVGNLMSKNFSDSPDLADGKMYRTTSPTSPIVEKTRLEGEISAGGRMQFRLIDKLTGDAISGEGVVSGNGESLDEYTMEVTLDQYTKPIKLSRLSKQFAVDNLESEHKSALEVWGAEFIDKQAINAWTASPTHVIQTVSGDPKVQISATTAMNSLTENDKISPLIINYLTTYAETGGTTTTSRFKKITPMSLAARDIKYALIVHPNAIFDLKRDSEYRQEARERAKSDTFFNWAAAVIDNTVIFAHEGIPTFTSTVTGVYGCKGIFVGASSLCLAWGRRPFFTMEETNHARKKEVGWNIVNAFKKFNFNSIDMNSVGVYLACTKVG